MLSSISQMFFTNCIKNVSDMRINNIKPYSEYSDEKLTPDQLRDLKKVELEEWEIGYLIVQLANLFVYLFIKALLKNGGFKAFTDGLSKYGFPLFYENKQSKREILKEYAKRYFKRITEIIDSSGYDIVTQLGYRPITFDWGRLGTEENLLQDARDNVRYVYNVYEIEFRGTMIRVNDVIEKLLLKRINIDDRL